MILKELKISAIIPVFNGKLYLREAIDSVIQQTIQPVELIILDDGSSDGSLDVIEGIEAGFPIHIVSQKNQGQSAARNAGAKLAKGALLAFLDQDDIWYKRHLEKLVKPFYEDFELGFTYSNVDQITGSGQVFRSKLLDKCDFQHPQTDLVEMLKKDMYILPSATLIHKDAFLDVGMFDERLSGYEDDDLFLRFFVRGWKRTYISESLSAWRIHAHNSGKVTGAKSRRIYLEKMIEQFPSLLSLTGYSAEQILGARFYDVSQYLYSEAIKKCEFSKASALAKDIIYYGSLMQKKQNLKQRLIIMLLSKPKLYKVIKNLKKFLLKTGK